MARGGWLRHQHRTHTLIHLAAYCGVAFLLYVALKKLAPVLTPIMAAAFFAYLLDPLVDKVEKKGLPRTAAVLVVMLGFFLLVVGIIALLIPLVAKDVSRFVGEVPGMIERATAWAEKQFGVTLPHSVDELLKLGQDKLKELDSDAMEPILHKGLSAIGSVLHGLVAAVELILIPVFTFYFLLDWNNIVGKVKRAIPPRYQTVTIDILKEIDRVVSGWIRGQFTVVFMLCVLYAVAMAIVGVPMAVVIGIIVGLLTFIPYIGTAVGFVLAGGFALLGSGGWADFAWVVVIFVVLHLLESMVLTPVLVGKKVGISEASALFAIITGGHLLGITGMILAIPIAASIAIVVRRLMRAYSESQFYSWGSATQLEAVGEALAAGPVLAPEEPDTPEKAKSAEPAKAAEPEKAKAAEPEKAERPEKAKAAEPEKAKDKKAKAKKEDKGEPDK